MNRTSVVAAAVAVMAAAGGWWLRPVAPVDTPYFHWSVAAEDRFELVVGHAAGNPEFRSGVTTPRAPRSGTLRIVGAAGAADPGAIVEVRNPRTSRAYATAADANGAFTVEAQVGRGDELKVISRQIRFRPLSGDLLQGGAVQPVPHAVHAADG